MCIAMDVTVVSAWHNTPRSLLFSSLSDLLSPHQLMGHTTYHSAHQLHLALLRHEFLACGTKCGGCGTFVSRKTAEWRTFGRGDPALCFHFRPLPFRMDRAGLLLFHCHRHAHVPQKAAFVYQAHPAHVACYGGSEPHTSYRAE